MDLTERQKAILYAIVTEFIETATPVGSNLISYKYNLDVSPATIRYEMVKLADEGYISKSHSSSGRIPTVLGYRKYISDLMLEEPIDYMTEILIARELQKHKINNKKLMRALCAVLADITKYASIVLSEEGIHYAGLYNLIDYQEFSDRDVFKNILISFDDYNMLSNVFNRNYTDSRVKVIIGEESNEKMLYECSIVYTELTLMAKERIVAAVLGPKRMHFRKVIPIMRSLQDVVNRIILGWI
ncbi:MAG: hypothetical protein N3A71_00790 [Candidatus Dojkabacteria bacterium]|nr:hypothetical protein [Candidatus Dojkabacteria bacterium]